MKRLQNLASAEATFIVAAAGRYCASAFVTIFFVIYLVFVLRLSAEEIRTQLLIVGFTGTVSAFFTGWLIDSQLIVKKGCLSWMLGGSLATSSCMLIMFAAPTSSYNNTFPYAIIISVLWSVAFVCSETAFWSLTASFSYKNSRRELISSRARALGVLCSGSLISICLIYVFFSETLSDLHLLRSGASVTAAILFATSLMLFGRFKDIPAQGLLSFSDFFKSLIGNDQLITTATVMLFQQLSVMLSVVAVTSAILFLESTEELLIVFALPAIFSQITAYISFPKMCKVFSRRGIFLTSAFIMGTGYALLIFFNPGSQDNTGGVILAFALANLGIGWSMASTTVMTADCIDYGEFKLRKRVPCVAFCLQTAARRLALPLALTVFALSNRFGTFVYHLGNNGNLLLPTFRFTVFAAVTTVILMTITYLLNYKLHGRFFENVLKYLEDDREGKNISAGYSSHPLRYAINEQAVICRLHVSNPQQAIRVLTSILVQIRAIDSAEEFLQALKEKNEKSPAGIAEGIAIPHATGSFSSRPAIAIATLDSPLDFNAADGRKCDLIFMIVSPDDPDTYISLLGQLSLILNTKGFSDRLRKAVKAEEITDRILQCEKHLKF